MKDECKKHRNEIEYKRTHREIRRKICRQKQAGMQQNVQKLRDTKRNTDRKLKEVSGFRPPAQTETLNTEIDRYN